MQFDHVFEEEIHGQGFSRGDPSISIKSLKTSFLWRVIMTQGQRYSRDCEWDTTFVVQPPQKPGNNNEQRSSRAKEAELAAAIAHENNQQRARTRTKTRKGMLYNKEGKSTEKGEVITTDDNMNNLDPGDGVGGGSTTTGAIAPSSQKNQPEIVESR
eukprot:TRINITY_DN4206_c0_g3_i2.p1 TRINITY_DN4206_c0_g3~~TRINITY_DN4206_c0_g3_i2.p1  ORF type:complete len:157 (+),score=17.26 TRINITY_DN4206_c0_g3_i2:527-997(+)